MDLHAPCPVCLVVEHGEDGNLRVRACDCRVGIHFLCLQKVRFFNGLGDEERVTTCPTCKCCYRGQLHDVQEEQPTSLQRLSPSALFLMPPTAVDAMLWEALRLVSGDSLASPMVQGVVISCVNIVHLMAGFREHCALAFQILTRATSTVPAIVKLTSETTILEDCGSILWGMRPIVAIPCCRLVERILMDRQGLWVREAHRARTIAIMRFACKCLASEDVMLQEAAAHDVLFTAVAHDGFARELVRDDLAMKFFVQAKDPELAISVLSVVAMHESAREELSKHELLRRFLRKHYNYSRELVSGMPFWWRVRFWCSHSHG